MGMDVVAVAIAATSLVVAIVAAVTGAIQARSARKAAAIAQDALVQSRSQAVSARESAHAAQVSAESAARQTEISRRQLDIAESTEASEEQRRRTENPPGVQIEIGSLRQQLEPLELKSSSGPDPRAQRAWIRPVKVTRRGGPRTADLSFSIETDDETPDARHVHLVLGGPTPRLGDHESTVVDVSLGPELAAAPIAADFVTAVWCGVTGRSWRLPTRVTLLSQDEIVRNAGG